MTEFLTTPVSIDPTPLEEINAVLHHHTKTHKKIDRLGRTILNDKAEKYRDTPIITTWAQLLRMLVDEYWKSTERITEAELIACFDYE